MWSAEIFSVISIATKQFWWDNENEMSCRETLMEYSIIGSFVQKGIEQTIDLNH